MTWILVSAPTEADAPDEYYTGAGFDASINNSETFTEAEGNTIESLRTAKGTLQTQYPDRDIRIAEATVAITIGTLLG
ncbi:MAG: hypothetical protein AAF959_07600 [Cyanobacteria bacterium P01_D01_bin.56]